MQQGISLKKNMLWNSFGSFTYLGCQWLITVFVVRLSSHYEAAGTLALAMAIGNIFAQIAQFKMRAYQVSDVNRGTSAGEYVALRLITIAAAILILGAYAFLTCGRESFAAIILYLLYKAGDYFIDVLHGIDQQNMRMDICGKSLATRGVLSLASFCLALGTTGSLELAVAAMCFATFPIALLDWRASSKLDDPHPHIKGRKAAELLRRCAPAVAGVVCCTAIATVARQQLNMLSGSEWLGIYSSACTPVVIVQAGASYVYNPLLGLFAKHYHDGNRKGYLQLLLKVFLVLAVITIAAVSGFFLLGQWFLNLIYNAEIASYSYLLGMAVVSAAFSAAAGFLCDQLIAVRNMHGVLIANLASLAFVLAMGVWLIQAYGLNGTNIATAASYALSCALMLGFLLLRIKETASKKEQRP